MNTLKDAIKQPVWEVTVKFWSGNEVSMFVKAPRNSNLIDLIYGDDQTSPLIEGVLCALQKHKEKVENISSVSVGAVITKEKPKKAGIIRPFVLHKPDDKNEEEKE